jgi:arylsulfatase A-like enzyme
LIFSAPGKWKEALSCHQPTELLDLSATLLEIAGAELPEYHQGKSLLPILTGEVDPEIPHRDSVRCEYFDALAPKFTQGNGTFATMYLQDRYKLVVYHSIRQGELFDLETDPWEHRNLWDDPRSANLKARLLEESFHDHVLKTTDVGSERIAPM